MKKKLIISISIVSAVVVLCCTALVVYLVTKPAQVQTPQQKEMTLMIYMIGSDLEAKGGSGTKDLDEIKESGVDLSKVNVVVYTGGSKKWHNDTVTNDSKNSLIVLNKDGFKNVKTFESVSMGDSKCLSSFLNYAHDNYPAKRFSLVLWDHGNGPLIGYGKDMLFGDDALTLIEMSDALKNSPFSKDKKLSFVGFDACLMSSAELVCTWDDYADYLIASQEIEPSFGWDYSCLKNLCEVEDKKFFNSLTKTYLDTCEEYYEKKGYDDRDTTLSCMDLSQADNLRTSINALFKKAINDVESDYNNLMFNRVNTRSLGRASTGSEYDLVDLNDMATQLESKYPAESAKLKEVIGKMVVCNSTNAQKCCGLSLYYPFHNKSYFEKTWSDMYQKLNVFSDYTSYINAYTKYWLMQDVVNYELNNVVPDKVSDKEFKITLTDEQEKIYANSSYYILEKKGEQLYKRIYTSSNIEKDGNELVANFDGNIVYATDGITYLMPVITEHDTVEDISRFTAYTMLGSDYPDASGNYTYDSFRFHIAVNNKTKQINKSALLPYESEVDNETLIGGKIEEPDLSKYEKFYFPNERYRFLSKDESGNILPVNEWSATSTLSRHESYVADGIEFIFAPLKTGDYVLIFEIEDTKGNKYCSDVLPIKGENELKPLNDNEAIDLSWEKGESVKLLNMNNVELYLTTIDVYGNKQYAISAKNKNDFDVMIELSDLGYNGNHYCDSLNSYLKVEANSSATDDYALSFGDDVELCLIKDLESLRFNITIREVEVIDKKETSLNLEQETYKYKNLLVCYQPVNVKLSDATSHIPKSVWGDATNKYNVTRGIKANQQVLCEENGVRISLVKLGGDQGNVNIHLMFENNTNEYRYLCVDDFIFDSIAIDCGLSGTEVTIPPKGIVNKEIILIESDFEDYPNCDMSSIKNVALRMRYTDGGYFEGAGGRGAPMLLKVKLSKQGKGCKFTEGDTVIYEEKGVRISVFKDEESDDSWKASVVNNSGKDIYIKMDNISIGSVEYDSNDPFLYIDCYPEQVGDKEKAVVEFYVPQTYGDAEDMLFDLVFYDYNYECKLWSSSKQISLFEEYIN